MIGRAAVGLVLALLLAPVALSQPAPQTAEAADAMTMDALALYRSGDRDGALAKLDTAMGFYRQAGDRESLAQVLFARATILAAKGERTQALTVFDESQALSRAVSGKDDADTFRAKAHVQLDMGRYADAATTFGQERAARVADKDRKGEGEAVHTLGFLEAAQGRNAEAATRLEEAVAIRREVGDAEGEARSLDMLGMVQARASMPDKALASYEAALVLWKQLGDAGSADKSQTQIMALKARASGSTRPPSDRQRAQSDEANDLHNDCISRLARGDYAGAEDKCDAAIALARRAGDRGGEARALMSRGLVDMQRGDHAEAEPRMQAALTLARQGGGAELQANALNNLAVINMSQARYAPALVYLERAAALFSDYDPAAADRALGNIAAAKQMLGRLDEARADYEKALPRQRGAERVQTLGNLAVLRWQKKDYAGARDLLVEVVAQERQSRDPLLRTAVANLGAVQAELGDLTAAKASFDEALDLNRKLADRLSEASVLGALAELQARQGAPAAALDLYAQALKIVRDLDSPPMEAALLAGVARVQEKQARLPEALAGYLQAIQITEAIRAEGQTDETRAAIADRWTEAYERAALLQVRLGRPAEAFELTERARARSFLDQLAKGAVEARPGAGGQAVDRERLARLAVAGTARVLAAERARPGPEQDAARIRTLTSQLAAQRTAYADTLGRLKAADPEYASLITAAPLKAADVQRLLDEQTTLLSYFVTPDATLAFVVTRGGLEVVTMPVKAEALASRVEELRAFASVGGPPSPALAWLSEALVDPVRAKLKTPMVAIAPHGALHLLPFAALRGATAGSWFGDEHVLFNVPSASALPFIQQKHKATRGSVLAIGQGRAAGLPPLKHAEAEAQAIASAMGGVSLVGPAATEAAFRERAGQAGVIHLAAHGQLNAAAPLFSRIVLIGDDDLVGERDGGLEVREIYGLDLKAASLVVLSACQTQLGAQSRGDEVVGLSRAFIYAGAPSVLASLWSVDDAATEALMTAFYAQLRQGKGPAAALQAAQAEVRKTRPDPFYWAAFVLTGDPS